METNIHFKIRERCKTRLNGALKNKNNSIKIYVLNGLQNYKFKKFTTANLIPVVNTI